MDTATAVAHLESFNPATGTAIGSVPTTPPEHVQSVVDAVARVQPAWGQLTLEARGRYLERAAEVLLEESDDIRDLIVREQGKPRNEAFSMELLPTIDALGWIAKAGAEILADEKIPMPQLFLKTKHSAFTYEPLGVIGIISPWNYPWSIPFGEVALALMAGNGVVLKPASLTPLLGERIAEVFYRAGVPEGLIRVVHGPGTGAALAESSVGKVFFTGSVETGRSVGEACARRLKGCVLELGGKDPMIVLGDAHLDHAIAGAVWGGFANAGQTCSGIERAYVMRAVADRFVEGVVAGAQRLRVGDPMSWDTEIGPMVTGDQLEIVRELVDDAVAHGATLRCGGPLDAPAGLDGAFYAPAVLTGVTHEMRIMREEIFGPVLPIIIVDSEEEAVRLANDSDFGLGASVWTSDRAGASGSRRSCNPAWCGSTTTCSATAPASARGVASRTPASAAPTRSSACTSASTSSSAPGRARRCAIRGGIRTTRRSARLCVRPRSCCMDRRPPAGARSATALCRSRGWARVSRATRSSG